MLRADVFGAPGIPAVSQEALPQDIQCVWSPISATLISGRDEAVLVDCLLTRQQGAELAEWIQSLGKRVTAIYITHGHGDHFFGMSEILRAFPKAQPFATKAVVSAMEEQVRANRSGEGRYAQMFPNQLSSDLIVADVLPHETLELEGHALHAIRVGQSDTAESTSLHVPDIRLVVAGDVVYNDVHQFLGEAETAEKRAAWIASIQQLESLAPHTVVCGHKRPGAVDSASNLAATKQYIRDFEATLAAAHDERDMLARMKQQYPKRMNPHALWRSIVACFQHRDML